ncbi:hypothetical protein K8R32_01570 [bacterium]|nr:hypothetical protein [bacterium]
MRSYTSKNIRKLTKSGSGSYYVVLPREMVRDLSWSERQKLQVKRSGKRIIIEDWPSPRDKGGKTK